jgi:hypothetical protein
MLDLLNALDELCHACSTVATEGFFQDLQGTAAAGMSAFETCRVVFDCKPAPAARP